MSSKEVNNEKKKVLIRKFKEEDTEEIQKIWTAGFLEMCWEGTKSLGCVLLPTRKKGFPVTLKFPRPLLALCSLTGLIITSKSIKNGLIVFSIGIAGLALLHAQMYYFIKKICVQACTSGDMSDISKHWQIEGKREFFIAESVEDGSILGSVAVRIGGFTDGDKKEGEELEMPNTTTVWKVTTKKTARGLGVGRLLMREAELWATFRLFFSVSNCVFTLVSYLFL